MSMAKTLDPFDVDAIRARVAEACRVLGELDITPSTFGHASARLPGTERIFIRARGPAESGVRYTTAGDVIEIDLEGKRVGASEDGYASPLEVFIHTELYRRRPEVNAVVHVHPAAAVLLTICDKPLAPIYGAYDPMSLALVLEGVPLYPKSTLIRNPVLGREMAEAMGGAKACLLRGHGVTTVGNSVEEAALVAIHLNTITTMSQQAHILGGAASIPEEEQEEFRRMIANADAGYGDSKLGVPSGRAANLWQYFVRYTEDRAGDRARR